MGLLMERSEEWDSDVQISVVRGYAEIAEISALADEVWHEHYASILSKEQVDYMVDQFQSMEAIADAIADHNYTSYAVRDAGLLIGYCAAQPQEKTKSLFLSKIYLLKDYRGRRLSRLILAMLCERCISEGLTSIWLTVNRHNLDSIAIYEKLGFQKEREIVTDIGSGFVMDDYVMRYNIQQTK